MYALAPPYLVLRYDVSSPEVVQRTAALSSSSSTRAYCVKMRLTEVCMVHQSYLNHLLEHAIELAVSLFDRCLLWCRSHDDGKTDSDLSWAPVVC